MNTLTDILKSALLALTVTVMTSALCSCAGEVAEPVPVPGGVEGSANVGFELTVSDSATDHADMYTVSRAPADGTYDPGSGLENYIDIPALDYRFYFFSNTPRVGATDNKYIGAIDIISFVQIPSSPGMKRYTVVGSIPAELASQTDFKVCVLANWKTYPSLGKGDDISILWNAADAIFTTGDGMISDSSLIPLYGIREFSGTAFSRDVQTDLGCLHLLRAYAKVEVCLDSSVYPVDRVTVTRVSDRGFKAPHGVDTEAGYVHNSYEQDYVGSPHIPASAGIIGELPMHPVVEDGADAVSQRRYIAYLPEYDNTGDGAVRTRIHITYMPLRVSGDPDDGTTPGDNPGDFRTPSDSYVDFKYYKDQGIHRAGEFFDILRNYWYRFSLSQGPLDLTVNVDVQPYAGVELMPDFGLERDEEGYIIVRNHKGEVIRYIRPDGAILTLGPVDMPYYGTIQAVFDSKRRALIGYLPGGRRVYWNYNSDTQTEMTSWEIYSDERDENVDVHLDEDYIKTPSGVGGLKPFTQSFYDDRGRVIERYVYPSNEAFERRKSEGEGAVTAVRYTGSKYGAKVLEYIDGKGKVYCTITVSVGPDGKETETYS